MKIDPQLLDECRAMLNQVAPELENEPLYILDASEVQPLLPRKSTCYGFALDGSVEHVAFAEHLGNRWFGQGPVIVLDGSEMAVDCRPGCFERVVRSVAIHEAAHILPPAKRIDTSFLATPLLAEWQAKQITKGLTAPPPPVDDPAHDARFIRRAMHLYFRALAAGYDLACDGVLTGHSKSEHYLPLIVQQALAMYTADFVGIEATEPPAALLEQFESDRQHFHFREKLLKGEFNRD